MSRPILSTKLFAPQPRPNAVPRPHLVEQLEAGRYRRLGLVCAPAGSGKTTLVGEWLHDRTDLAVAWLSLDPAENEVDRFLAYLLAALARIDPIMTAGAETHLSTPQSPPLDQLVETLINDITLYNAGEFVLVLDDYHVISDTVIHQVLERLLEHGAPQMHLVIISRQDPPLPLSRLRARDQLTELRQRDLRFSADEVLRFLRESMKLQVTQESAAVLNERTEGWVAGLQMAALSLRGREPAEISAFVQRFSGGHHHVLDYLTDEVLVRQPAPVQDLLLRCSILERFNDSLCDALMETSGEGTSQVRLKELEEANLFLVPLDQERRWFRFHHLFADLLNTQLRERHPELVGELHRRAAVWLEQQDLPAEAVEHALSSMDYSLAADMIGRAANRIGALASLDVGMLLRWLEALPVKLLQERPWLRLYLARARYLGGAQISAMQLLAELESELSKGVDLPDLDRLRASVAGDRASYAVVRGEVRQAMLSARQALAHMEEKQTIAHFRPLSILAMAHFRAGELREAEENFNKAIALIEEVPAIQVMIPLVCNLAEIAILRGQLDQAMEICRRVLEMGKVESHLVATTGFTLMEMGKIHYQRDELAEAEKTLRQGAELLSDGGIAEQFGTIHCVLALVLQAQGDAAGADEAIHMALEACRGSEIERLVGLTRAHQARLWMAQAMADPQQAEDKLALAATWADEFSHSSETEYLREFEELTLASFFVAQNEWGEACTLLDRLIPQAEKAGRTATVIEALALRALALEASEDRTSALADLGRSLSLAWPQRILRPYLDGGRPMAELLRQAATHGVEPNAVSALLERFDLPEPSPQPLIEPLTKRELEVLALLAAGHSNPEIGRRLHVSLPTVKTHTRNIYGKLGVNSRQEAVDRAYALRILPGTGADHIW